MEVYVTMLNMDPFMFITSSSHISNNACLASMLEGIEHALEFFDFWHDVATYENDS